MSSLWLAKKEQLWAQEMAAVGTAKTRRWLQTSHSEHELGAWDMDDIAAVMEPWRGEMLLCETPGQKFEFGGRRLEKTSET